MQNGYTLNGYRCYKIEKDKHGFYISWKNASDIYKNTTPYFVGSGNNIRHWKTYEKAEAYAKAKIN